MSIIKNTGLERKLGAGSLAVNAINLTVGAGIFVLPAHVAGYLGTMSFLAYIFCGVLMSLIMLCFAEMGSTESSSGGAYSMIEDAFGPLAGFLANTLFWFGYSVLADAAILNVMLDMLGLWFPVFKEYWFRFFALLLVIGLFAFINIRGVKSGTRMVIVLTIIKLTPLVLLIIIGVFSIKGENLALTEMPNISTFGVACLMLFFAFMGSETALNISGEIKNPGKAIPKGIFMGMGGILIIYLLLQIVVAGVLGPELELFTKAPLAETAIKLVGPIGGTILVGTSVISIYAVIGSDILVTPRLPFAAAVDGLLPASLARVHTKYKTPHVSILFFSALLFIMSISGGFKVLAILASSSILLIYLGVVLAMFKSRWKPNENNPPAFTVPGGYTVPILSLGVLIWLLFQVPGKEFIALAVFFAVTTLFYFGFKFWKG